MSQRVNTGRRAEAARDGLSKDGGATRSDSSYPYAQMAQARGAHGSIFDRHLSTRDSSLLVDDILPPGTLIEFASVDALNCFINYVELRAVITERDPEEDERYISISNQFYTHFHEFGTVIHVVASSDRYWWYFCYDIDANDCAIGRVAHERVPLHMVIAWVKRERLSGRYPVTEIDTKNLKGWRSFQ